MRHMPILTAATVFASQCIAGHALAQAGSGPDARPRPARPSTTSPAATPPREQSATSARTVDLRPRFETGQSIRLKMVVDSTTEQHLKDWDEKDGKPVRPDMTRPAPGQTPPAQRAPAQPAPKRTTSDPLAPVQDSTIKSVVELDLVLKVREAGPSGSKVDLIIDSIKSKSSTGDTDVVFDPAKPTEKGDPVAMAMRSLIGTTMSLTLDPAGTITSITGGDALAMLGGSMTLGPGSSSAPGMPGGKQLFQQIFTVKAGSPVATIGQTWENESVIDSAMLGQFRMKSQHRLTSASGNTATIELRGTMEATSQSGEGSAFQVKESSNRGQYLWDTQTGFLREMNQTMSVKIDGNLMGQAMTTDSISRVTVRRIDRP